MGGGSGAEDERETPDQTYIEGRFRHTFHFKVFRFSWVFGSP